VAVAGSRILNSLKLQTDTGNMNNTKSNRQAASFSRLSRAGDAKHRGITLQTECCMWQQGARPSPIFLSTASPKPHFSVKYIGVSTYFVVTAIRESRLRV